MNSIQLIGRLTKDPEPGETNGGTKLTKLRLAVPRRKDQSAVFVDVTVYGAQAETVARYMAKGRQVAVTGRLEYGEWRRDGVLHTRHEVVANEVTFLGSPQGQAPAQDRTFEQDKTFDQDSAADEPSTPDPAIVA
ncbi:MAG: single-stranded DNA-binding protein [Acidimicrobiia bacterium]|nr:single-stranded DNA-binding protein [Acidimicrobiia bacterium]